MKPLNKLTVIKNTFPRVQFINVTEEINAEIFNSIVYYANKELGEEIHNVLHEGDDWIVTDHLAVRVPRDVSVTDENKITSCYGFKVYIGGMGGTGKRDEIRRHIQNIVIQSIGETNNH